MTETRAKAKLRRVVTHALLIGFLILVLVPYIMVVSASFRRGNLRPAGCRTIPAWSIGNTFWAFPTKR